MTAGSGFGGLYHASCFATMASRGLLRRCRFNRSLLRPHCASSALCSSCASLPSTSSVTRDFFPAFSSSSSLRFFRSWNEAVAGEREGVRFASPSKLGQLDGFVMRQFGSARGKRRVDDTSADPASIVAKGCAGWRCMTHWTERLCTDYTRVNEMRQVLRMYFGHQTLGIVLGQKTRSAPGRLETGSTELFSCAAYGVGMSPKHRLSRWHGDQNGALWFASSRGSPILQPQGVRHVSMSASRREQRRKSHEFTENDMHTEQFGEGDLDFYMRSRYDQESLKRNEDDSEDELSSETVQTEEAEEDLLWSLKPNNEGKFDNVVAILGDPRVLAAAHERLNSRRRNWTLATNELEVSHIPKDNRLMRSREIDRNWFKEAAYLLRTGSYPFKPVKRLDIARRGRSEPRQWTFVRPKDQVVQEAIRGILERIYEPLFSDYDSDIRPGASVHSALKSVKYGWKGISWFLQFAVQIADHGRVQKRLLSLLAEKIEDDVFLDALRQMFKAGTIWVDTSTDEEKPEGSVLSPVLGNIYFHHLDLEINRIRKEINSGSQA